MKVKLELIVENDSNTRVVHVGHFDTKNEEDRERFFTFLDDRCPHNNIECFVKLLIERE